MATAFQLQLACLAIYLVGLSFYVALGYSFARTPVHTDSRCYLVDNHRAVLTLCNCTNPPTDPQTVWIPPGLTIEQSTRVTIPYYVPVVITVSLCCVVGWIVNVLTVGAVKSAYYGLSTDNVRRYDADKSVLACPTLHEPPAQSHTVA